jgi:hypothetical protein
MRILLAFVFFSIVFSSNIAFAVTDKEVETTFFSDKSMQKEVGFQVLTCSGRLIKKGKRTQFSAQSESDCGRRSAPLTQQ